MNTQPDQVRKLALTIATCPEIESACQSTEHDCHKIVTTQKYLGTQHRQAPEPWAGNLLAAPILFLASNPSISENHGVGENYPLTDFATGQLTHPDWDADRVADFHVNRFDQNREKPYVIPEARFLCKDGEYRGSNKSQPGKGSQTYWRKAFSETEFLLGRKIDINDDVCLTEVVHCKSKKETDRDNKPVGLQQAAIKCASNYLNQILKLSPAVVVVASGAFARDTLKSAELWNPDGKICIDVDREKFGVFPKSNKVKRDPAAHIGVININEMSRIVIAVRHLSNGFGADTFAGALGPGVAARLAAFVQAVISGEKQVPKTREELLDLLGL